MILSRLLNVPSSDPDDAIRRRLLNILLLGILALLVIALAAIIASDLLNLGSPERVASLYLGDLATLAGVAMVWAVNRYGPGWLASSLFLAILTLALAFTDEPMQVVDGRSLFTLAIPIFMASVLLRPYASFFMVAAITGLLCAMGARIGHLPSPFSITGFLAFALVSWLSARSLQRALHDVRKINVELDQRVDDRTRDLAEALAREHAEASKTHAILTGIADGVIVFDMARRAIVANPAIGRLLDRPTEDMLGCDIEALMGKDVDREDQEIIVQLLEQRESHRGSVKVQWGERTLSVSFAPVLALEGGATGTVAVFRDFTREAEVDRMKSDFVSIVSHELRTPLTSMKGYLDLVVMGAAGPVNKQQSSFLTIARDNAERLNELVTDLLDISRIEAGRIDLNVQVVSVQRVIERVAAGLRKEFQDRGLALTLDLPPALPEILGDPGRISQIITNLLSNACKYTQQGGATIRARMAGRALQVDVIDTGIGLSPLDQEKLFTRFFRAENAVVRQQPGTGLGLNITRSLVEMHGGQIWVDSRPGQGSTFSFTLPLPAGLVYSPPAGKMPDVQAVPPPPLVPPATGARVLVVDDEPEIAQLFQFQLACEGYRVSVVTQGSRVLEIARQLQPDLITLDLLMDVDGGTILAQLKDDPATRNIPVLVVSVVADAQNSLTLGAADYLVKPLREGELLAAVRSVLEALNGGARNRILVVDDDRDIVGWLAAVLSHCGYEVLEAYDGLQALEVVSVDLPDLILLDLMMPRMDGRTVIRRLREQEATRHIPIVVLTASQAGTERGRAQILGLGVQELLRKPVTIDQLVEAVRMHLGPAASHPGYARPA